MQETGLKPRKGNVINLTRKRLRFLIYFHYPQLKNKISVEKNGAVAPKGSGRSPLTLSPLSLEGKGVGGYG